MRSPSPQLYAYYCLSLKADHLVSVRRMISPAQHQSLHKCLLRLAFASHRPRAAFQYHAACDAISPAVPLHPSPVLAFRLLMAHTYLSTCLAPDAENFICQGQIPCGNAGGWHIWQSSKGKDDNSKGNTSRKALHCTTGGGRGWRDGHDRGRYRCVVACHSVLSWNCHSYSSLCRRATTADTRGTPIAAIVLPAGG